MFEVDDDGTEWIGYSFGSDDDDPQKIQEAFLGNVQYAEWFFRKSSKKRGRTALDRQLHYLFEQLPPGTEVAITDDRDNLIREIVRVRARFAHGQFEQQRPSSNRMHTLSIKVAALLSFVETSQEGHTETVLKMARGGSPYLRKILSESDTNNAQLSSTYASLTGR